MTSRVSKFNERPFTIWAAPWYFVSLETNKYCIQRYLLLTGMNRIFTANKYSCRSCSSLQSSFVLVLRMTSNAVSLYCKPAFAFFLYWTRGRSTENNGTVSVFCSAIQWSTFIGSGGYWKGLAGFFWQLSTHSNGTSSGFRCVVLVSSIGIAIPGWTVQDLISGVGEIFCAHPDRPWDSRTLLYKGTAFLSRV